MRRVNLANAKARLSELIDQVEIGDSIEITRRGKPVARLVAATPPRKPVDLAALQALTAKMPWQEQSAGEFIRWMRDTDRY